jgi:hypothetical protein
MRPHVPHHRLRAAAALRAGASYRLAAEAAEVSKVTIVRWMKDEEFRRLVEDMPAPDGQPFYAACDVEAGWVSVLIMPEYRLSEAALGEIILTACIHWADADKFTVAMPDTHVFTLVGIAPQCVVSLHTDVLDILARPGSLMT